MTGTLANYSTDVNIGNNTTLPDFLEGTLDDVRIYDRALSTNEISELYSATMSVSSFGTVGGTTVCAGNQVNFYDQSSNNPVSWNWNITPTVGLSSSNFTVASPVVTFPSTGVYTVNLQANGLDEEGTVFTQTINIVNPNISVIDSIQNVCNGQALTFHASGATSYTWSNGGGLTATGSYTALGSGIYTVTGSVGGCLATTTVNINTLSLPQLTVTPSKLICKGEQILLTASGASSYLWTNSSTTSTILVSPTVTAAYIVTGIGSNGCNSSNAITVSVSSCTDITKLNKASSYIIFPNPTQGKIVLRATDTIYQINSIEVIDALGNIILKKSGELFVFQGEIELDLANAVQGVYFVKIQTPQSEIHSLRIIKE